MSKVIILCKYNEFYEFYLSVIGVIKKNNYRQSMWFYHKH